MAKKEPTSQTEPMVPFATQFADLGSPQGEPTVETPAEAAVRKQMDQNAAQKETYQKVEEDLVALEQGVKAAHQALRDAQDALKAAQAEVIKAEHECDRWTLRQTAANQMNGEEINRQYLESQKRQRYEAAMESKLRFDAMLNAGLLSREELQKLCPAVTPLDKAISEQNTRKQQALARDAAARRG